MKTLMPTAISPVFCLGSFVLCFGLQIMLFFIVFLFALCVNHPGSVPVGLQWEIRRKFTLPFSWARN
jgi:hypothetical protein